MNQVSQLRETFNNDKPMKFGILNINSMNRSNSWNQRNGPLVSDTANNFSDLDHINSFDGRNKSTSNSVRSNNGTFDHFNSIGSFSSVESNDLTRNKSVGSHTINDYTSQEKND